MRYIVYLLLLLSSCKLKRNEEDNFQLKEYSYIDSKGNVWAKGNLTSDGLQTGLWTFTIDSNQTSSGRFVSGLLYGRWSYDYPFYNGVIDWDTISLSSGLQCSYPNDFEYNINDSIFSIVNPDSTFRIDISDKFVIKSIPELKQKLEKEISQNGFEITKITCKKILYNNNTSYMVFYDMQKGTRSGLIYAVIINSGKEYYQVCMRSAFVGNDYQYLMTIYLDIINNLVLNKSKLIDRNKVADSDC